MNSAYLLVTLDTSPIMRKEPCPTRRPAGTRPHRAHIVADKQHRRTSVLNILDTPHTFILKSGVTYRKGLVDDQQVRRCIDGDCKRQPDIHAAGIYLYRLIYEAADICECGNAVEALISLASRQTQNGGIQVNIFTAGKLRIETSTQFQKRRDAAASPNIPDVGVRVPQIICSNVDLPDPFRPIIPTVSPRRTSNDRSRRAQNSL